MRQKSYDTVTEAITNLKTLGYTIDFSILSEKECLICHHTETVLSPDDFKIDDFFRFEGESDPGDQMIVYAISSKKSEVKGIVVNAYGIYAENASSAIVKKLNAHPEQSTLIQIDTHTESVKNENNTEEMSSPEGTCPLCWGYQQYDGKVRTILKDKQIDINNHKDSDMLIQEFMKHNIDGVKLKDGIVTMCSSCSMEMVKNTNR